MSATMNVPFWLQFKTPPVETPKSSDPAEPKSKPKREPAQWRQMTELERRACRALGRCSLPPRTATKRLCLSMANQAELEEPKITDKQAVYLWSFVWTYRRQIKDPDLLNIAKQKKASQ